MEKTKTKEVVVKPKEQKLATAPTTTETLIAEAVKQGASVETLEKLIELQERVKATYAKEQFIQALAAFQSECPIIEKTKKVLGKDGKVRYQYAPLDSIVVQIRGILTKNNLSYTIDTKNENEMIVATAKITHTLGHSETSSFAIPIDKEGYMTTPQKYASALTFAKRYALCNALGILTGEEDTDATDVGPEKDAKSEKSKIIFNLRTLGYDTSKKEEIEKAVKKATSLVLEEKNYGEIISRLEITVKENQQYDESQEV